VRWRIHLEGGDGTGRSGTEEVEDWMGEERVASGDGEPALIPVER